MLEMFSRVLATSTLPRSLWTIVPNKALSLPPPHPPRVCDYYCSPADQADARRRPGAAWPRSLDVLTKNSQKSVPWYIYYINSLPRVLLKICAGQRLVRSGKDPKHPLPDLVGGLGFRLQALDLRVEG